MARAKEVAQAVTARGVALCVTHGYAGYPMIREARALIAAGRIGALHIVQVEYFGSGLAIPVEALPDTSKGWRLDPRRGGPSLVLGNVGTHAHHLTCYLVGEAMAAISAEVGTIMPGRAVHDYAQARFRLSGGALGSMVLCQRAAGTANQILLRSFGAEGHSEWRNVAQNELRLAPLNGYLMTLSRGHPTLSAEATRATRFRCTVHPEGLHEAFANLYCDFAELAAANRLGLPPDPLWPPAVRMAHG